MPTSCHHCKASLEDPRTGGPLTVTFRDTCPACHTDLHVCLNCEFYDEGSHHECRESQAEWVRKKDTRNTCEYFRLAQRGTAGSSKTDCKSQALANLDNLFKK